MYWPNMNTDLKEAVQRCAICEEAKPANTKEPLMTHPLPTAPWQVVASDCLEVNGQHYCVFVDLYSDFIEVAELKSDTLIKKIKPIFATHGLPAQLITDNGPNYSSREFRDFARLWDFHHVTTSPHHSQANGKAESAVKIIKGLIKMEEMSGEQS